MKATLQFLILLLVTVLTVNAQDSNFDPKYLGKSHAQCLMSSYMVINNTDSTMDVFAEEGIYSIRFDSTDTAVFEALAMQDRNGDKYGQFYTYFQDNNSFVKQGTHPAWVYMLGEDKVYKVGLIKIQDEGKSFVFWSTK